MLIDEVKQDNEKGGRHLLQTVIVIATKNHTFVF